MARVGEPTNGLEGPIARRLSDQPVVCAGAVPGYGAIFNSGVLFHDNRYHLFARAVRDGYTRNRGDGPRFLDYISDVLVFESVNGHEYQFRYVLARSSPHDVHCYEDPRVQRVVSDGIDHVVMTYTDLPAPHSGLPWRIGATHLLWDGSRFYLDESTRCLLGPTGMANKDAVIFNLRDGRVALIHRLYPNVQIAVFASLRELWEGTASYWDAHVAELDVHTIITPTPGALGVGAGAPPLESADGLLFFFHERRADGVYTANVALLDHESGRVKHMLNEPVLVPELEWERYGDVDDVVFVQGAHRQDENTIYLTYGAADRHVGAAVVHEPHLLQALRAFS